MSSENVDRLSMLPEEIISHILSLMPTKFAVRTSILSKRWRCRWMFVTNLNFEHIQTIWMEAQNLSVSRWIDEVIRLNVFELDMHWLPWPLSIFTCKTLTKLRLNGKIFYLNAWEHPFLVDLPCLKSLDMAGCDISFVEAFKLICGCPVVESLSLKVSRCHINTGDYIFNIPTLKQLKLAFTRCCSSCMNKVVLNVPNLEYLFVGGVLYSFFEMEDVSSLLEASFSFGGEKTSNLMWVRLIKGLSRVGSLSLQNVSSYFDYKIPFTSPPTMFLNMKHLELKGLCHSAPVLYFLESCPELKHIYVEKLEDSDWIEPKWVPACMVTKLTTMKLSNCNWRMWDTEFMGYMLGNAQVLKKVTITWENSSIDEVDKRLFAKLLNSLPKASSSCEIHFQGLILPAVN